MNSEKRLGKRRSLGLRFEWRVAGTAHFCCAGSCPSVTVGTRSADFSRQPKREALICFQRDAEQTYEKCCEESIELLAGLFAGV